MGAAAPGGLEGEPQAGAADLARGGLRVPPYAPKRRRVGESTVPAQRLRAERPNHVWALDFLFDATSDGRPIKVLTMCDEFTRESIGRRLGRSITADDVVASLDQARRRRGAPQFIRCDNGPELVAAAITDWCRFAGTGTAYIEPGSPWQNPFVESFNGKARDELFAREIFDSLFEARPLRRLVRRLQSRPAAQFARLPGAAVFAAALINPEPSLRVGPLNGDRSATSPP